MPLILMHAEVQTNDENPIKKTMSHKFSQLSSYTQRVWNDAIFYLSFL